MGALYSNGFSVTLTGSISAGATSIALPSDPGSALPTPANGDWMYLSLSNIDQTKNEIIKVTGRSGATLNPVARGQQGTSDQSWSAGEKIELRVTADSMNNLTTNSVGGAIMLASKLGAL